MPENTTRFILWSESLMLHNPFHPPKRCGCKWWEVDDLRGQRKLIKTCELKMLGEMDDRHRKA